MPNDPIAVKERHERFVTRVIETKVVWALDKGGDTLASSLCSKAENAGSMVVPFWSERAYAEQCAKQDWAEYQPKEFTLTVFLSGLLPHLEDNGFFAGTDWNSHLIGTELDPADLAEEIKQRMEGSL